MSYTVIWRHQLVDQMADIYVRAREQGYDVAAITAAVANIDALLKSNPASRGESRAGPERILMAPPLVVEFEVYEDEKIALVTALRYHPRRS